VANTNFLTWTEFTDPTNALSRTSARTTVTALSRNATAVQYKDMGAGYVTGNYTHYFTVLMSSSDTQDSISTIGFTTDNTRDVRALLTLGVGSWEGCRPHRLSGGRELRVGYVDGGNPAFTATNVISVDTIYYCTLTRTGTNLNIKIYTDANRTILFDNKTQALPAARTFRHAHIGSWDDNTGTGRLWDGYYEDYDFGEGVVIAKNLSRARMANSGKNARLSRGGIINAN
jgi:hypothetical protein